MSPAPRPGRAALSIAHAMDDSAPLARLLAEHRRATRCLAVVTPLIPPALRAGCRAGPLEEGTWTLLVEHGSAAAKLRQALPLMVQALADAGETVAQIRLKVAPRAEGGSGAP